MSIGASHDYRLVLIMKNGSLRVRAREFEQRLPRLAQLCDQEARRYRLQPHDQQDVLQETCVRVWERYVSAEDDSEKLESDGWLRMVARNVAREQVRVLSRNAHDSIAASESMPMRQSRGMVSLRDVVRSRGEQLTGRQREALDAYMASESIDGAARLLGIHPSAFRRCIDRAARALRRSNSSNSIFRGMARH